MEKSNKGTSKLVIRKQNDREPRLFQYIHQHGIWFTFWKWLSQDCYNTSSCELFMRAAAVRYLLIYMVLLVNPRRICNDQGSEYNISGRIIQELTVLPDADISEPEMNSDDDKRSSSVVEEERMPPIDATFKETVSFSSCILQEPQSHVYAAQCNSYLQITESELEIFLRALLKISLVPVPRYSMYWSTELRCDAIADAMSRNRFQ
ncbi:PiggyBac transposable element-derived protein [Trichinella spiralis]|uniref:PiggyBac transposable element-derived protein n=1 Tax=Trichinella spiralis TaxID=6334 RepID=A0ABR3KJE2_TRISP